MYVHDVDVKAMLIGLEKPAFNDKNFLYEIKMDGIRCLAYIYPDHVDLRNKRDLKLNAKFPELQSIWQQVKEPCILDGELYVFENGRSNFFDIQKRALTSDTFKVRLLAASTPAVFTAFDILYYRETFLFQTPLIERKKILNQILNENEYINSSRYIEENGIALLKLTQQHQLEGIVAKRKDSFYIPGKRTKDWIKCKNLLDDDFVVCGYIKKANEMVSLILAQYDHHQLIYKGHVTLGVSLSYLKAHVKENGINPFEQLPPGNEAAIWITPHICGTVKFMEYTATGGLRQPVFKGFREDKRPQDCTIQSH